MDRDFCRQADKGMLVEAYVAGKLKGDTLQKFEKHLEICAKHLQAVSLEKALKNGIAEFARSEMKWKIRKRLEEKREARFVLLRYAAILFVAVLTPLMLYYQFNIESHDLSKDEPIRRTERAAEKTIRPDHPAPSASVRVSEKEDKKKEKFKKADVETPSSGKRTDALVEEEAAPVSEPALRTTAGESAAGYERKNAGQAEQLLKPEPAAPGKIALESRAFSDSPPSRQAQDELKAEMDGLARIDSAKIGKCIRRHLSPDQRAGYLLVCRLIISDQGTVTLAGIEEGSIRSEELENCLTEIINNWKAGAGEPAQIRLNIRYPFGAVKP